jgi:hypothetical protein|nr:MAG TPA: hypothetical protein [Caudoviricetes sp.]
MKCFYIEARNEQNEYVWIKFVFKKYNDLYLSDIIRSINQYLINTFPSNIFFTYPNILFVEENPTLYRNYSKESNIRFISTEDHDAVYTLTFSTYQSLKEALYNLILEVK